MSRTIWKRASRGGTIALALLASPLLAPQLLAFPHVTTIGQHRVYSETSIRPSALASIVDAADAKVAKSPIGDARAPDQSIFLTNGGWRWTWLAPTQRGAFALTRPLSEKVIVNRSDVAKNQAINGRSVGGVRTLSGTIAHEMIHGSIRAHFGIVAAARYPRELVEGYCDYVAGGGSLSDTAALALIAQHSEHPALPYWRGRKRVSALLQASRGSVDALFANWPN